MQLLASILLTIYAWTIKRMLLFIKMVHSPKYYFRKINAF